MSQLAKRFVVEADGCKVRDAKCCTKRWVNALLEENMIHTERSVSLAHAQRTATAGQIHFQKEKAKKVQNQVLCASSKQFQSRQTLHGCSSKRCQFLGRRLDARIRKQHLQNFSSHFFHILLSDCLCCLLQLLD